MNDHIINFEVSWEVANKLGGIYTVLSSKSSYMSSIASGQNIMIGPWIVGKSQLEIEINDGASNRLPPPVYNALTELGVKWYYGNWSVPGSPETLLLDYTSTGESLEQLKRMLNEKSGIQIPPFHEELENYLRFGWVLFKLCQKIACYTDQPLVVLFHEWMSSIAVVFLESIKGISTVFTTHATILGRYLCSGNVDLYRDISKIDPFVEAKIRGIYCQYLIERTCAHKASVFTTVSNITAFEAEILLQKKPDGILPNGISIRSLPAVHDVIMNHIRNKKIIDQFVEGHFLGSVDTSNAVYCFIAGRNEFRNKGFDLFLDSLNVAFIISNSGTKGFNSESLLRQLVYERFGNKKYTHGTTTWKYSKHAGPAPIVTHNMQNENDLILNRIRDIGLVNKVADKVKVVYMPEFLDSNSPLFPICYEDFISGCHVGVFPSYYEPWGYTPAECIVNGVCSVSSNLSGFGCFMEECLQEPKANGLLILDRRNKVYHDAVAELRDYLFAYCSKTERKRLIEKHRVAKLGYILGWGSLISEYSKAINLAKIRCERKENINEKLHTISTKNKENQNLPFESNY